MNAKYTIQQFAEMMSRSAGQQPNVCEDFLRALFSEIEKKVVSDSSIELQGFGKFTIKTAQETGSKDVDFTPDEKLALSVNGAFSNFEPEVLRAGVTEQLLSTVVTEETTTVKHQTESTPIICDSVENQDYQISHLDKPIQPSVEDVEPEPTPEPTLVESEPIEAISSEKNDPQLESQAEESAGAEKTNADILPPTPSEIAPSSNVEPEITEAVEESEDENTPEIPDIEDDERGVSNITMFIIGLVIGLAVGAAVTFFYMSSAYTPKQLLDPEFQTEEILSE